MSDQPALWLLFYAAPVVWLPTLVLVRKRFPGARRRAVFQAALRQAAALRRAIFYGSLAYSAVVWGVTIGGSAIGKSRGSPHEGIFFSAAMLVIYAAAGVLCSAALAAAEEPGPLSGTAA